MYLVDTNIILEFLLEQEQADVVEEFLQGISPDYLFLSEFAFYSIGLSLFRRNMQDTFLRFVNDMILENGIPLVKLHPEDMDTVVQTSSQFTLDFDDAYQYVAAEKYGLTIVSFDAHFDRTTRGRKTPGQALAEYVQREEDQGSSA